MAKVTTRKKKPNGRPVPKKITAVKAVRDTCATRLTKNVRHIENIASQFVSGDDPAASIAKMISPQILSNIHNIDNINRVTNDRKLASLLTENKFPRPGLYFAVNPLFRGQFQFVQITFNVPGTGSFSVSTSDTLIAKTYAESAIIPMLLYASQYGLTGARVNNNIIQYSVTLTAPNYNDTNLQTWVNQIIIDNNLPTSTCIVVLTPSSSIRNTSADMGNALGYHSRANVPYIFCYVTGQNLTIADRPDFYASILSHEMEETIVDPNADGSNPEVADPCYNNCSNYWLSFFDNNNNYLRSSQSVPPATDLTYSYFINSVVRPRWATVSCPMGTPTQTIPPEACSYRPPTLEEVCQSLTEDINAYTSDIEELHREMEEETDPRRRRELGRQIRDLTAKRWELTRHKEYLGCR